MSHSLVFILICLVPGAFLAVLLRYRTGLLGMSLLNAALVSSASVSAFFFGWINGLEMEWFTDAHCEVVKYSVAGCLAMALGMFLAWRPLSSRIKAGMFVLPPSAAWLNPPFGWATFGLGLAATLSIYVIGKVPTVSTALDGLQNLMRFGIFVLLVVAVQTGRWRHFLGAIILVLPILVVGALRSGHTPLSINVLVPIALIIAFYRRATAYSLVAIAVFGFASLHLMSAWMSTRDIIRSGSIEQFSLTHQAEVFLPAFVEQLQTGLLDLEDTEAMLRDRVDMSDLLALQRLHQPDHEPYAYGETFLGAFTGLVPRVLWPGKPNMAGGSFFVQRFTGMIRSDNDPTSIGLPYQFEFFANGGPVLVVIGLFFIGYVSARAELTLFQNGHNLKSIWGLAVVTLLICDGGQRADITIPSIIAGGIAAWSVGWLVEWRAPAFARLLLPIVCTPMEENVQTLSTRKTDRGGARMHDRGHNIGSYLP